MAVVAYNPCVIELGVYTPSANCIDEGSGILGMFLMKKGFNIATVVIDPASYAAAKTAKDIIPIKDLEAYWPAANQQTIPGLSGRMERHGHFQYEFPFKHEGVDANLTFWNTINQSRNYGIAFVTEEMKVFSPLTRLLEPVLASISAKPASDQEFGKTRFFEGTVKWKHKDLVQYLDNLTQAIIGADFE